MIDTHCHLNFTAFKEDAEQAMERARAAGVSSLILVGSQYSTSERGVAMAQAHEGVYAAIGLHPIHLYTMEVDEEGSHFTTRAEVFDPARYAELVRLSPKVVAVGECGLDYFHFPAGVSQAEVKAKQRLAFEAQIDFARELSLPLIIHCREAYADLFAVLQIAKNEERGTKNELRGVNHCFLGNREQARQFLELGFLLSFTGIITFKNVNPEVLEVVKETPLTRLMVETDAPYLAPTPYRGKRNEPAYVTEVAKKIADLKGVSYAEVDKATTQNARALFRLT